MIGRTGIINILSDFGIRALTLCRKLFQIAYNIGIYKLVLIMAPIVQNLQQNKISNVYKIMLT